MRELDPEFGQAVAASRREGPCAPLFLHVLGGFGFGGTEQLCLTLLRESPSGSAHLVVGLDPTRRGMEAALSALPGVRLLYGPGPGHRAVLRWLRKLVQRERPQAVISYLFGVDHLMVALAVRLSFAQVACVPIAVSVGNPPPAESGRWKWRVLLLGSRLLGVRVQACSHAVLSALRGLGVGLPQGSGVIPNACDVEAIAAAAAESRLWRVADGRLVIGMVARLNRIKDHRTLLGAGSLLKQQAGLPPWELWIVGDGEERSMLERECERLGLINRVHFLGSRGDVPCLLGRMDIYAFSTTRDEGFGVALVEAMAAGLPVVASDVPACREVLAHGEAGVLVAPSSAPVLADALSVLLKDPGRRRELGAQGCARARACYGVGTFARRWYSAVLPCGRATAAQ